LSQELEVAMRNTRWIGAIGLVALLASPVQAKDRTKARGDEVIKEGKILVVRGMDGEEPQITDESDKRWLITGPLREEVLRLSGHKIKVWAREGDKKMMTPTLNAREYEILDAGGGRRPVVGSLRMTAALTYSLERKEGNLPIKGSKPFLEQLGKHVGCKVWLVGDLEGKTLKAFKYGWLSCKTTPKIKTGKESKR
jgi:hypothetical protein